jgi:Protein of unknown function (DUF4238)
MKFNKQRTIRQHTVPRSYLARFLPPGGKNLFVFDKFRKSTYETILPNIAVENGFYDLPNDYDDPNYPRDKYDYQFLEHGLAKVEAQFKLDLNDFLSKVEKTGIQPLHRAMLAPYLVIQWMRGREHRERIRQQREKLTLAQFKHFCKMNHPDIPEDFDKYVELTYNKQLAAAEQMQSLIDGDYIESVGLDLLKHIWVVGINRTMQPFYTSDNPVIKMPHILAPGRSLSGFRSQGIEIAFPLSSTHILVMYERHHHHQAYGRMENTVNRLNAFGVERYNQYQVKQSYRQVFCTKKEFEQAEGVCRRFPEVCDPNRNRVNVEVNGDQISILHQTY